MLWYGVVGVCLAPFARPDSRSLDSHRLCSLASRGALVASAAAAACTFGAHQRSRSDRYTREGKKPAACSQDVARTSECSSPRFPSLVGPSLHCERTYAPPPQRGSASRWGRFASRRHALPPSLLPLCSARVALRRPQAPRPRGLRRRAALPDGDGASLAEPRSCWTEALTAAPAPTSLRKWFASLDPALRDIIRLIDQGAHRAWIVGGAVRDVLSQKAPSDVDIATTMSPEELCKLFPRTIRTGEKFGVVTVRHEGAVAECCVLRTSYSAGDGDGQRLPEVVLATSLKEDLGARDFTINAMAFDPARGLLYDAFGGLQDAEARVLRAVTVPAMDRGSTRRGRR